MLRLLLAVAFLLPLRAAAAAVPSASAFALQEPAARTAAEAYAAAICKNAPASCTEAKALHAAYVAALGSATECDGGKCTLVQIEAQAKAIAALDLRDAALTLPAGARPERAFLALSAIATSRLTSAATRLGQPYAVAIHGADAPARAKKSLAGYCLASPPNCEEMGALVEEGNSLGDKIKACAAANCALEAADPLVSRANGSYSTYFKLDHLSPADTMGIFGLLSDVNAQGIALYSPLADGAVADLAAGADKLNRNLDLAEKDASVPLTAVDSAGPALLENHRRAARAADRLSLFLGYAEPKNGAQARRAQVNAVAIKLSGLRARALALRTARGLGEDKAGPGAAGPGAVTAAGPGHTASAAPGSAMTEPQRTLLDRRLVPAPAGPKAAAPRILPGDPNLFQLLLNTRSSDPAVRADALRRLKMTKTVGDPGRYAAHAFAQEGDDSCAVAAQVAVLRAHGILPASEDPKAQERALVAEAKSLGYMKSGTPPNYTGSLLIERGMLVDKHVNGKWPELESALRRGGVIQASVDARKLWKIAGDKALPHSILVTGTEVARNGKILGVYINDTGTDPAGAGKFIPIGEFRSVWFGSFAEVR